MDKREFLKASGAFAAGSMLSRRAAGRVVAGQDQTGPRENWAGNLSYGTGRLYTPGSPEEACQVVKSCAKMRALGTRHSFNAIADSTENQISLKRLEARPIATLSIEAQERHERRERVYREE